MFDNISTTLNGALDGVRDYAHKVVNSDDRFSVDEQKLETFSRELVDLSKGQNLVIFNHLPTTRQKVHFILYFGVANFSYINPYSGKDYVYETKSGEKIARTNGFVTALLAMPVRWDEPESILELSDIEWRKGLQLNNNDLYLENERIESIRKIAQHLEDGTIRGVYDESIDADILFSSLMETNLFVDPFLKRIQIVLYFLQTLAESESMLFSTYPRFSAMADYRLPQVLINTGILRVDVAMHQKLVNGEVIKKDSTDETLLRAYTIHICELLAQFMDIPEARVDGLLWAYSQHMLNNGSSVIPAPRVATDSY